MASIWTDLRRLSTRKTELLSQLAFLKRCRIEGIFPQSTIVKVRFSTIRGQRSAKNFSNKLLSVFIQDKRTELDEVSYSCYITYLILAKEVHKIELDKYMTRLFHSMEIIRSNDRKHQKKFVWLKSRQNKLKTTADIKICHIKPVPFYNIAEVNLDQEETKILELGPKYCFPTKLNYKQIIPEVEAIITAAPYEQRDLMRGKIVEAIGKHKEVSDQESKKAVNILKGIREKSISIVKADKSNHLVLIKTEEYNNKLQDHIEKMKCKIVKRDPTNSIKLNISKIIKDESFPKELAEAVNIPSNSSVPKLFGRIKTHKNNNPARPVVARFSAPTYGLEKVLSKLVSPLFKQHQYLIQSTEHFTKEFSKVEISPRSRLFSLDVISLFPSTPIKLALDIISSKLISSNIYTTSQVGAIMKAFRLVTDSNYFKHNGIIYKQEDGAPMGSPVSAILAEAVMQKIEEEALSKVSFRPSYFARYVDDCIVVLEEGQDINELLSVFNSIHNKIQFTMEEEVDGMLPFLDINIKRRENRAIMEIFRKPTAPSHIINRYSSHPESYKKMALKWYSQRAHKYCNEEEGVKKEMEYIYNLANEHGYMRDEIPKCHKTKRNETTLDSTREKSSSTFRSMSYIQGLSEKVAYIARKGKVTVAHRCNNSIYNIIHKDRESTPKFDKDGIYKIPIVDKDGNILTSYVGLSNRKISERIREHKNDVRKGNISNAIARYTMNNNQSRPDWDNIQLIATHNNKTQTFTREGVEIQYSRDKLCNIEPGVGIHPIWNRFLGPKTFTYSVDD